MGPEDWDAVRLFYRLHGQWRVHAMSGVRLGIDYAAVAPTATLMGIGMTPALFDDIAIMERAALAVFATA
ncbi:MAG: DUF1799 domain-containing protein [Sphingomonas aquatilis]|uniref:DUF1799 domain-containing protein n=1 Tax=Sphingomonas aquatilis TaxID=93063 RepID=UPI002F340D0A